uniref:Rab GDP dissociation inhibitor n=1 Tax=Pseudictyota dubia TaxID=2749911 RepID=A0A7R9WAK8_9STRA|eukprot:CAMPEP_0197434192 /NCGR_PEP_ID=MMETSP1175-20131217/1955_1 /TAXON_ID=1003142 /ORGANISM="Triceratium dubium, Strain CCMP147" /LENGTH=462 /DNA_ID=CAMNT_0042962819 /DNA_START=70 /DNA_END=1458 /DNA_ORIENTATION=-
MAEGDEKPTFDWLPEGMESLADGEYDAIVMGTGLKECVISGLLSVNGMKVLHLDRNGYYGADCASLNLTNLYKKFNAGEPPSELGTNRDYNVDLIPKLIMACGNLTKMLLHSKVTRYLDFKQIDGSYVYKGGKVLKVPATPEEALKSSLMGLFEKRRFRKFLIYIDQYEADKPDTHQNRDLSKMTMRELYNDFGLQPDTHEFISHAMCLQLDDAHLDQPAAATVKELQVYCYSLARYGTSPYIYPVYGLGGLPEGFSRLCAIHGGTFMLNRDIDEILYDESGAANGVKAGNEMAKAKMVIGDPSYFPKDKVKATGQVVRCICLLNHPIPNVNKCESVQIIIPGPQVGRKNDIFICSLTKSHEVSAQGVYIAIVSTKVEKSQPEDDIAPGIALLGHVMQKFTSVATTYEPVADGSSDKCFISSSFDGTSHFENDCDDMLSLYKRVTGKELDMTINADSVEADY